MTAKREAGGDFRSSSPSLFLLLLLVLEWWIRGRS